MAQWSAAVAVVPGRTVGSATASRIALALSLLACSSWAAQVPGTSAASRAEASNAAAATPPPTYPNCTDSGGPKQHVYTISVVERDAAADDGALISHVNGSSDFNFNFATAWFPPPEGSAESDGLVVRVVECSPNHHKCPNATHPEWSNAGALTIVAAKLPAAGEAPLSAAHVKESMVTWGGTAAPPRSNTSRWGAADPRMTYRPADKTYYLTWDNCTQNCYPHRRTMLSTSKNPFDPAAWTFHGPVFPFPYTSGASLLFRDGPGDGDGDGKNLFKKKPHLAFVCNSNTADKIFLAESNDGLVWTTPADPSRSVFMGARPGCWDQGGVAAGAQPERLSNGDYLYIYNIDTGFPYHPNPLGRCAIGWAILDGDDPSKIVARSQGPLLTSEFPWEQCPEGKGRVCQEPMVVFSTGLKPLGGDEFYVMYGAADTDVGVAKIKVNIRK